MVGYLFAEQRHQNLAQQQINDIQAELDRRWADYKEDPFAALNEDEFRERIRIARGR